MLLIQRKKTKDSYHYLTVNLSPFIMNQSCILLNRILDKTSKIILWVFLSVIGRETMICLRALSVPRLTKFQRSMKDKRQGLRNYLLSDLANRSFIKRSLQQDHLRAVVWVSRILDRWEIRRKLVWALEDTLICTLVRGKLLMLL